MSGPLGIGPLVSTNVLLCRGLNQAQAAQAAARRPQQGMGLQNPPPPSTGGSSVARREPLATLEMGEGGDPKRIRR